MIVASPYTPNDDQAAIRPRLFLFLVFDRKRGGYDLHGSTTVGGKPDKLVGALADRVRYRHQQDGSSQGHHRADVVKTISSNLHGGLRANQTTGTDAYQSGGLMVFV